MLFRSHAWMLPFHEGYVCPVLDARKKEVYSAVYHWKDADFEIVLEEGAYRIDEVLRYIDKKTVFIGDGLKAYGDTIRESLGAKALFAPRNMSGGLPSTLARLASARAKRGEFTDMATFSPVYFRKSEAEIKRGK